jgi:hypothetical protein
MANKRIKDITTASSAFASDDFLVTDSATSGTRKITKDNLIAQVSAGVSGDYLEESNNLSDVASKDTAKLNLEVPDIGSGANEVSLNGMLNSGAWVDWDSHYSEGTWTPSITFGGGSTGLTTSSAYGHYLKVGSLCYAYGRMVLTSKGSSTGNAELSLPLTAANREDGYQGGMIVEAANLASLTSSPSLRINDNVATGTLKHWSSTGTGNLTHANFTDTTIISYAATYQIA